jgi:ferritin-like metal-binding protein YciE
MSLGAAAELPRVNASIFWRISNVLVWNYKPSKTCIFTNSKNVHSAEKQIIRALPKMAKAAANSELAAGFNQHLEETKEHVSRLETILKNQNQSTRGPKCKGMEGLLTEGAEMMEEEADEEVRDAGLIAAAQRVEHYEISGYGTARTYAELLGDKASVKLLQQTLDEEAATDERLTKLAISSINISANK